MIKQIIFFKTVPPPPDPGCKEDRECSSKLACIDRECQNPCSVIRPCAPNAECEVHSSLPLRTMSCTCIQGYTGKGVVVSILDDGIEKNHPDLQDNYVSRVLGGG